MRIASVGRAFPAHYYSQGELSEFLTRVWRDRFHNPDRVGQIHSNTGVQGRYLAKPLEWFAEARSFTETNDTYIECAIELSEAALLDGLSQADLLPGDVDHIFLITSTGIAEPTIDAHLLNKMALRPDIKRTPTFGLGCVGGVTGIARASDYLKGFRNDVAVVLSVELCSLTLQHSDTSTANVVATGLFGDGAAAAVMVGAARDTGSQGPQVVASRAVFYADTEDILGFHITTTGLRFVLLEDVPRVVHQNLRANAEAFLAENDLTLDDIERFICHTGGPKILDAVRDSLGLSDEDLAPTRKSLAELGNLASGSALMVLYDTMNEAPPDEGSWGLMIAMGPGFCSELVLLRW